MKRRIRARHVEHTLDLVLALLLLYGLWGMVRLIWCVGFCG